MLLRLDFLKAARTAFLVSARMICAKFIPSLSRDGLGIVARLLAGPITVAAPALLGVVRSVRAPMFLAERTVLLCPALLGLLGGA